MAYNRFKKYRKKLDALNNQENKKIMNAQKKEYDNIQFKSILELNIYKRLKLEGFDVKYEHQKYQLVKGFTPTKPFYQPKNNYELEIKITKDNEYYKINDITYTPDFQFIHNGYLIIIEGKGFATDTYNLKKKLFRRLIETFSNVIYFEIHNLKHLEYAIRIIKNL